GCKCLCRRSSNSREQRTASRRRYSRAFPDSHHEGSPANPRVSVFPFSSSFPPTNAPPSKSARLLNQKETKARSMFLGLSFPIFLFISFPSRFASPFPVPMQPRVGLRTTSTEQGACDATACETEPSRKRVNPRYPPTIFSSLFSLIFASHAPTTPSRKVKE